MCQKLHSNSQHLLLFIAETIQGSIFIKYFHQATNCSQYADQFYHFMIDTNKSHIPLPLIMFTCAVLHHAFQEWQQNSDVPPKASKSKLKADTADYSTCINCHINGGMTASCSARTDGRLLTSPAIADTDTFWMNSCNTPLEHYQQRVYVNIPAIRSYKIQQVENPIPARNSTEAASVDNITLFYNVGSKVLKYEHAFRSTDPNSRQTTIVWMANRISLGQGPVSITRITVMKLTRAIPAQLPLTMLIAGVPGYLATVWAWT